MGFGNRFGFGGLKVWKLVPESIGRGCGIESDGLHRDVYTYICIHIHTHVTFVVTEPTFDVTGAPGFGSVVALLSHCAGSCL